jgi:hypothetical protein
MMEEYYRKHARMGCEIYLWSWPFVDYTPATEKEHPLLLFHGERFFIVDHPESAWALLMDGPNGVIVTSPEAVHALSRYLTQLEAQITQNPLSKADAYLRCRVLR